MELSKLCTWIISGTGLAVSSTRERKATKNLKTIFTWLIYGFVLLFLILGIYYHYIDSLKIEPISIHHDSRIFVVGSFFAHYHCPAIKYTKDFLRISDQYGLDFRLLPAISLQESTCFKRGLYNNYFGVGSASALEHYISPIQGIERAAQILVKYGIKRYGPNQDLYPKEIKAIEEEIK